MIGLEVNFVINQAGRPLPRPPVWPRLRYAVLAAGNAAEGQRCFVIKLAATCLSGARSAKRVLPHRRLNGVTQVCPERSETQRRDADSRVAFSLGTCLLAKQKKVPRLTGRDPSSVADDITEFFKKRTACGQCAYRLTARSSPSNLEFQASLKTEIRIFRLV